MVTWRGRTPSRLALNVQTSLLLMVYLLTTAGLGVFWVANQQLPAFDLHYLFGYATLLLVSVHLVFNLPAAWRGLRRRTPAAAGRTDPGGMAKVGKAVAVTAVLGAAFFLGTRQAPSAPALDWNETAARGRGPETVIEQYHAFSSESRAGVFRRAPGIAWGAPPPAFKHYPNAPAVALARGVFSRAGLSAALRSPALRSPQLRVQGLRLADLGELLHLSAGVTERRGGTALRASPSSGALFPSELYVVARRVAGLPAGLYHYDAGRERLARLASLPPSIGAPQADDADAVVIVSAIFRRTGYKYRDRAYRYALADAGHLLENLRVAAHGQGVRAGLLARFDEARAAEAIGIDGVEEGVLAMVGLHAPARPGTTGNEQAAPARFVAAPPPSTSALGVTGVVHRATSLSLVPEAPLNDVIALPAPTFATREVHDTIVNRRSARRFSDAPVTPATLASMLADTAQGPALSDAIRINLVLNRVAGIAPGVYRYLPGRRALALVRAGDFARAAHSAALAQDVIGEAAVVLVLSADRALLLADGARGYRHAFLEAGMAGERWLLGAVARGLSACPVGAFYDDEAARLIGVDGAREWVLHFAALGLPAP
ncbi:SagB/ThcOx family dehydrogenase [Massilia glaciei]|uniref:SagB/ThcOx family dehydrogenase n=1 Tax=Massilia glaciei TaxID=1524097 RepID=A0A2U2HJ74_9BURK|nr:SagB/ThcOx family dehydrogenase [Massilia glaciei]PWF46741.1 SagB/ThcOx family dehydrogenase [Massilia glaciei]